MSPCAAQGNTASDNTGDTFDFDLGLSNSVLVTPPLTFQVQADNPVTVDPVVNVGSIQEKVPSRIQQKIRDYLGV